MDISPTVIGKREIIGLWGRKKEKEIMVSPLVI
jgi:hypothetical protein